MPKTFHLKSQPFVLESSLFLNPKGKIVITYSQCISFSTKSPFCHSLPSLSLQTHIPKPILCARKRRRGSGSQKLRKILPTLISIAASNLKILPEPFNMVIAEFSGGGSGGGGDGGGGLWFWKGFDGWKRKRKMMNLGFLIVCGLGMVLFREELKIDALYGVLEMGLILTTLMMKGFKRGVKDLALELCFVVGALTYLRLKREDMQQWLQKVRVSSPVYELVRGKTRRRNGTRFL